MPEPKDGPREVTIKIPRLRDLPWPQDKLSLCVAIGCFILAYTFVSGMQREIRDLKKQQVTAEERIKKEVLMPGGSNTNPSEFKLDPKRDTAKDVVTDQAGNPLPPEEVHSSQPAATPPAPAPAPAPAPRYSPPQPVSGPGDYDAPPRYYNSGPSGPGNM